MSILFVDEATDLRISMDKKLKFSSFDVKLILLSPQSARRYHDPSCLLVGSFVRSLTAALAGRRLATLQWTCDQHRIGDAGA